MRFIYQLPQHVRQDAAVLERDELFGRVDAHERLECDRFAVVAARLHDDRRARLQALGDAGNRETLAAGDAGRRRRWSSPTRSPAR